MPPRPELAEVEQGAYGGESIVNQCLKLITSEYLTAWSWLVCNPTNQVKTGTYPIFTG
jgi:hypothetical protein